MRKNLILAATLLLLAACSSETVEEPQSDEVTVTLQFTRFQIEQQSMTRATDVSEYVTKLDIWLYENGNEISSFQQETGSNGFGSLSLTLNVNKTYTIYAVAHRVTSGHATLSNGIISFPDDKVTHSLFYSDTFQPTKGMQKVCSMNRIVAQFSFSTTDQVPDWCKTMRFTISNVYDRWNVTTGVTHQIDRVSTFNNFSKHDDGTVGFNIYAIVGTEATNHNILVEGLDANGEVQESHLFEDVPLRNNYRVVATGAFFTDAASSLSCVAEDWAGDVDYNF